MISQHRLWETNAKGIARSVSAQCADISSDSAAHVCIGLATGSCKVFSCKSRLSLFATIPPLSSGAARGGSGGRDAVTCVRYSRESNVLATATKNNTMVLYLKSVSAYEKMRVVSVALGGFVSKMDWSVDGKYVRGEANDDLLYWEVRMRTYADVCGRMRTYADEANDDLLYWEVETTGMQTR